MHGYLDLWTGLSGDMMVGCLLDAGWSEDAMRETLAQIGIEDLRVTVEGRDQHGIRGLGIRVEAGDNPPHRPFKEIRSLLTRSRLECDLRDRCLRLFERLAEVEGSIHGCDPEEVHFHEIGAADSIVDIVLSVAGLDALGIDRLFCGSVPLSRGEVVTAHGKLPVPAPATLKLLEGVPIRWLGIEGEWLTPTGALLLSSLVDSFGDPPEIRLHKVGTGAGSRQTAGRANIVRLLVGEPAASEGDPTNVVSVIETNIDDLDPRHEAEVAERLAEAGALDVVRIPVHMKKGRRGVLFQVLCKPELENEIGSMLLAGSTTLGVRIRRERRRELPRWFETVQTEYGPVRIKWSWLGDRARPVPEFEDLRLRSREAGVPTWRVEIAAIRALEALDRTVPPIP